MADLTGDATSKAPAGQATYTRQSSGLVREISLKSAIALNCSTIGIVYAILVGTQVPSAFPGANAVVATIIGTILLLSVYFVYGMLTRIMPRSGGEYIFITRTLHPWIGFFASVNWAIWTFTACALLAYLVPQLALSGTFAGIGVISGNDTLIQWASDVTKDGWTLAIAIPLLVLFCIAASIPIRYTMAIMRVLFWLSLIGVATCIIVLLVSSRADFVSAVKDFGGDYNTILRASSKAGYDLSPGYNLGDTLLAVPLVYLALGFGIATAYVGGEVRTGHNVATRGKVIALVLVGSLMAITFALANSRFGQGFLGGATFLFNDGDKAYVFDGPANLFFFAAMLSGSTFVTVVLGIGFIASALAISIPIFLMGSRVLFAWSFDRMVPKWVSDVDERVHSPIKANVCVLIAGIIYLLIMVFGPATVFEIILTQTAAITTFTFLFVGISAIVLPFRRKAFYEASAIRKSFLGVPVISILGVIAFAVWAYFAAGLVFTTQGGAGNQPGLIATGIVVVIAALAYPVARAINQQRGVDVTVLTRELPPE